jgi:hypothetical protein
MSDNKNEKTLWYGDLEIHRKAAKMFSKIIGCAGLGIAFILLSIYLFGPNGFPISVLAAALIYIYFSTYDYYDDVKKRNNKYGLKK